MIRVTLDLTCTICDHDQFHLPVRANERQQIRCANCRAFKCYSADLENEMIALSRSRETGDRGAEERQMGDRKRVERKPRSGEERLRQIRANAA